MKQQLLLSYYSHLRRLYRSTLQKPTKKSLSLAQALVFVMPYRGFVRSSSQGPRIFLKIWFSGKRREIVGETVRVLVYCLLVELFIQAEESLELNALLCFVPPTCYNKREEDWQTKMSSYSPFTFHLILEGAKVQTQDGSGMLS
jgi:hypothetical protein